MEEAEQLCTRIGVVDRGKSIALGTPQELIRSLGAEHVVELEAKDLAGIKDTELGALPSVQSCERSGDKVALKVQSVHLAVPPLLELLRARGKALDGLSTRHATLEDVFVHLTGRQLREEASS